MLHSIPPEEQSSEPPADVMDEDSDLPQDTPNSQATDPENEVDEEDEINILDAGIQGQTLDSQPTTAASATPSQDSLETATKEKAEVKLEDLFDDLSSDEEFPSSAAVDKKIRGSSPEEPALPM
jgi:DNA primase small subunit